MVHKCVTSELKAHVSLTMANCFSSHSALNTCNHANYERNAEVVMVTIERVDLSFFSMVNVSNM